MTHVRWSRMSVPCMFAAVALLAGYSMMVQKSSAQLSPAAGNGGAAAPATRPALASKVFNFSELAARPSDIGEQRSFFRSPTATLDELEIHVTTLKPGMEPHPPHRHPYEEMVVLKEGTLEVTIEGKTTRLSANGVMFFAPNDLHGWKNVGETPAMYWVISWKTPKTGPAR